MSRRWRFYTGLGLFICAELLLFGAAEGIQKWQWIEVGSIPNIFLTLGFMFLQTHKKVI